MRETLRVEHVLHLVLDDHEGDPPLLQPGPQCPELADKVIQIRGPVGPVRSYLLIEDAAVEKPVSGPDVDAVRVREQRKVELGLDPDEEIAARVPVIEPALPAHEVGVEIVRGAPFRGGLEQALLVEGRVRQPPRDLLAGGKEQEQGEAENGAERTDHPRIESR